MKQFLFHYSMIRPLCAITFFVLFIFSWLTPTFAGTYCPYGAIYRGVNDKGENVKLTIKRLGLVHLPHPGAPEGKKFPAFALEITLFDYEAKDYAWGFARSYTFLTNRQYLESHDVKWESRTEHSKSDFYRFMEDNGKDPYFTVDFFRCK